MLFIQKFKCFTRLNYNRYETVIETVKKRGKNNNYKSVDNGC